MKPDTIRDRIFSEFHTATTSHEHPFRFCVLGTIGINSHPQTRWVVFREFNAGPDFTFLIYTDRRSSKIQDLKQNPAASLLFYNEEKRLQLRINGSGHIITDQNLLDQHWEQSAKYGASSYTSELPPGTPISKPENAWSWDKEDRSHFCILRIEMKRIEFLQLDGEQHIRGEFRVQKDRTLTFSYLAP